MAESSAKTIIDTGDLAQIEAGRRVVVEYLEEARALERSLVTNLKAHIAITPPGDYRSRLERHLDETRAHAGNLGQRLEALSAHTSLMAVGVGIAQTVAGQAVVMAKGPIDLVRGATGEERLLKNAKDEVAAEALEIATYDALEEAAKAVGDEETAKLAADNRRDEEKMLADLRKLLPDLTRAAVAARTTGESSYDVSKTPAAKRARTAANATRKAAKSAATTARRQAKRATASSSSSSTSGSGNGAKPPIANYDELNVEEVNRRVDRLSPADIRKVATYERNHKKRTGVLEHADSKLKEKASS
jgi:ferritin-like metal-binding protein YciE